MVRYCKKCGTQIPQARLDAIPTTTFCVGCASGVVGRKKAITFLEGEGDHAATVVQFVDEEIASNYQAPEQRDILDVEPDQFARDPRVPLKIRKRSEL